MDLPRALTETWHDEPEWLSALPRLVAECSEMWGLELEKPIDSPRALVIPAGDAVLKLNAPSHFEAEQEADALALWDGEGAARLLARDDARRALLVERCRPGTQLWSARVDETTVISALLLRLAQTVELPHAFRLLADEARRWRYEVRQRYEVGNRPFDKSLLDFALDVFRSADETAAHLVNQDLHGGNVLRAKREPWLVVDPKPLVGEREIDGVGLLRNAAAEADPARSVRRWLDVLQDLGLDRDRLRSWGVAHALAWGWDDENGWSRGSIEIAEAILRA